MRQSGFGQGNIVPAPEPGSLDLRWNWSTPIHLSPHNPHTVYVGSQVLLRSTDRGDTWQIISPDLTTDDAEKYDAENRGDGRTGAENHCTIITISESPRVPGILWVGTDDGNVQVSRDGGVNWANVTPSIRGVPANTWVSRVRASAFEDGRAYVTFDGHRTGDTAAYVYATEDFGRTWKRITNGLPADIPAYVITEDPENADLLYLGTEHGVYASLDRGENWRALKNNLPIVSVHDLVVHPRDRDVIIATHSMGIWILDDVAGLQQATAEAMAEDFRLFESVPAVDYAVKSEQVSPGDKVFSGDNPPDGVRIHYWVGASMDAPQMRIESVDGTVLREVELSGQAGLHFEDVALRGGFGRRGRGGFAGGGQGGEQRPSGPLTVGAHRVVVTAGGQEYVTTITVLPDPRTTGR
jgi:photosystem II stability/assembly factor-like uncharacterized protein